MEKLIKKVTLPKNLERDFEERLSYDETLSRLFEKLIKESAKVNLDCKDLWRDVEAVVEKVFPEYNIIRYNLSYNWTDHKIDIKKREGEG